MNLIWDFFADATARDNISHVEIYRTETPAQPTLGKGSPDFVASVEGDSRGYSDNPPGDEPKQYWYWARYISKEGNAGPLIGAEPASAAPAAIPTGVFGDSEHDDGDAASTGSGMDPSSALMGYEFGDTVDSLSRRRPR